MINKRFNADEFLTLAKFLHGDKYDYSKMKFVDETTEICIICPIHGEVWLSPFEHLIGNGCPYCVVNKKSTKEEFILKANLVHNDKYDYSKVDYVNNRTKVCIICKKHGEFFQTPHKHLKGQGCRECAYERITKERMFTTKSFIKKAKEIHGEKYDYSEVEYKGYDEDVCIICPIHGRFYQTPDSHLQGSGCQKCSKKYRMTTEEYINLAVKIHGDKYDYSKVNFINNKTKISIICKEHGEFHQLPKNHLKGQGCPLCRLSHLEIEIANMLKENNIEYEQQKRFEWLNKMSLDFYLPNYNIAIECQGIQHFEHKENSIFDEKMVDEIKTRDNIKRELCSENNIKLLYFSNLHIDYPYYVYEDKELLLNDIRNSDG